MKHLHETHKPLNVITPIECTRTHHTSPQNMTRIGIENKFNIFELTQSHRADNQVYMTNLFL